jgi:aminoglycoside/choline kinase family phosphotransferase
MNYDIKKNLTKLFELWSGEKAVDFDLLPYSGSYRKYYRIKSSSKSAIGVFNNDEKENIAFLTFSKHFAKKGLNVPQIYNGDVDNGIYLQQDLGDETLYSRLNKIRDGKNFPKEIISLYKQTIDILPQFQITASKGLDYSVCYPRAKFDKRSMLWDLNYFKYYFLKLAKINFDEQSLENDFEKFAEYLLQADSDYFLYRDFQSRNIMLYDDKLYFIDYQGGRKGPLQYDLASLLFDSKADIPQNIRTELLNYYLSTVKKYIKIDNKKFTQLFYGFALIRLMQAMGAFGFRGFYEKKDYFLKSIPYAIENLKWLLNNAALPVKVPSMLKALVDLVASKDLKKFENTLNAKGLTLTINSFSYRNGIPYDSSGNGGGFVFDCRAIYNPGRHDEYKDLTGKDKAVIAFLKKDKEMTKFLNDAFEMVDQAVEVYLQRKYTNLMINFGCTGGRHRSVYAAERLAEHLKEKYKIKITLKHISLEDAK